MQQVASQTGSWNLPRGTSSTVVLDRVGLQRAQHAALLEVDVTRARRHIRLLNRGGQSAISFMAWLVSSAAKTFTTQPETLRAGPGRKSTSEDPVSVTVITDRMLGSHKIIIPVEISDAAGRAVADIEKLIKDARERKLDEATFVTGQPRGLRSALYRHSPAFIRRVRLDKAVRSRRRLEKVHGDVVISCSGMGGRVKGWFIPASRHPVCLGVGAVSPRAVVLNGAIKQREVFHMSVLVDDGAIDGSTVAPWIADLLRSMESARELSLN